MRVSRQDLLGSARDVGLESGRAEALWRALEERRVGRPGFDVPNVAYYLGAVVVIGAMTWFMTLGWERFGGLGILGISVAYAAALAGVGGWMWTRDLGTRNPLRVPGGLLVTAAVCLTPLAVYGLQRALGVWPQEDPGQYRDFYAYIEGGWFFMEVSTVAAGLVALRFVRFPFLTAPVFFVLWFMSMDLTPLLFGEDYATTQGFQMVSLFFGLVMLVGAFLMDRRAEQDYAFWGYLFGTMAFWGGLTALGDGGEAGWAVYGLVNLGLIGASVLLQRRVFVVFGAVGVFSYLGHLAWEIFENSLLFPFALSAVGLATIALGVFYARRKDHIERVVARAVPENLRRLLPRTR